MGENALGSPVRGPRWSIDRPTIVDGEVVDWDCLCCANTLPEARAEIDSICLREGSHALQ
jgi:hypothetical protein